MTLRHIPLTMQDWEKRLNSFIEMFDYGILQDAGKVSAEIAKLHAETEFEKYRVIKDRLFMSDFDRYMLELGESAKNTDQIPCRDGEIRQLNSLLVYGKFVVRADGLCRS